VQRREHVPPPYLFEPSDEQISAVHPAADTTSTM
jgi:hypothetical protein